LEVAFRVHIQEQYLIRAFLKNRLLITEKSKLICKGDFYVKPFLYLPKDSFFRMLLDDAFF